MNLNEYIDYSKMFNDIIESYGLEIKLFADDDVYPYNKIYNFLIQEDMILDKEETQFWDNKITFNFNKSWGQTESDSVGNWESYYITYSLEEDEFVDYDEDFG